ncbi:MAG: type II toxin-antitoxin system HigB family toxin [Pseudomonadota bacterium]
MHVITKKRLDEFTRVHPDCRSALETWYRIVKNNDFSFFSNLKAYFTGVDMVGKLTVFNIGGNKVRLIAAIHFNRNKLYVRHVLSHAEYDKGKWRD